MKKARISAGLSAYRQIQLTIKRIERAKALLRDSEKKIYEIALETGFEDPGYFSYCFKQRCGVTPKNYRQGADARAQDQP